MKGIIRMALRNTAPGVDWGGENGGRASAGEPLCTVLGVNQAGDLLSLSNEQ